MTIVLPAQGAIAGRVTLADGATPAASVNVYVVPAGRGRHPRRRPGDDGRQRRVPDRQRPARRVPGVGVHLRLQRRQHRAGRAALRQAGAAGRRALPRSGRARVGHRVQRRRQYAARRPRRASRAPGCRSPAAGWAWRSSPSPTTPSSTPASTGGSRSAASSSATSRCGPSARSAPTRSRIRAASIRPARQVTLNLRLQATSQVAGIVYQPDGVTPAPNVNVTYKSAEFRTICQESLSSESGQSCTTIPQGDPGRIRGDRRERPVPGAARQRRARSRCRSRTRSTGKVAQATRDRPAGRAGRDGRPAARPRHADDPRARQRRPHADPRAPGSRCSSPRSRRRR